MWEATTPVLSAVIDADLGSRGGLQGQRLQRARRHAENGDNPAPKPNQSTKKVS